MKGENIIALPQPQTHELGEECLRLMKTVFSMRPVMGGLLCGDYTRKGLRPGMSMEFMVLPWLLLLVPMAIVGKWRLQVWPDSLYRENTDSILYE